MLGERLINDRLLKKIILEEVENILKEQGEQSADEQQEPSIKIDPQLLKQAAAEWNQIRNIALNQNSAMGKVLKMFKEQAKGNSPEALRLQFFSMRWYNLFNGNEQTIFRDVAMKINSLLNENK